nr:hypothetical protein [Candidatus Njordarchaeota archaeon]
MSKEVSFPVMSLSITGIIFLLGILLAALGVLVTPLGLGAVVVGLVYFLGLLLLGWALLSYGLHPDIDESRRAIAFFFAILLVTVLFSYGVSFSLTVG